MRVSLQARLVTLVVTAILPLLVLSVFAVWREAQSAALLAATLPRHEEALADIHHRLVLELLAQTLAVLLGGYAAWMLGGRAIVAPMREILSASRRLRKGDAGARVPLARLRSSLEFTRVAAGFNLMAESLEQRQKELETELGHSRQAYATLEAVINSMEEGLMAMDSAGTMLMRNEAATRLLGLDSGAVVSPEHWPSHYGLYLPGSDTVCDFRALPIYRALKGESGSDLDFVVRNEHVPEGRWVRSSFRPMLDGQGAAGEEADGATGGRVIGALVVFTDITSRKEAETALAQSEHVMQEHLFMLQRAAEASTAIVLHQSLQGTLNEVVEQARAVIRAHQGIVSLTINQNWAQAVSAVSMSAKYEAYRDYVEEPDGSGIYSLVCETNRPLRLTQQELQAHPRWRNFSGDASRHPAMRGWLAVPLVSRGGENIGVLQLADKYEGEFTLQDEYVAVEMAQLASVAIENARLFEQITELNASLEGKVAERTAELTRQEQALRESNKELEAFSYSVSHDLRSPLSAINGFSQLLARQIGDAAHEEKTAHYLSRIQAGVVQMGELIEGLLSLAHVSRANVRQGFVDLSALANASVAHYQAQEPERRVMVRVEDGLEAHGDVRLIRVVIENLVGNAWKFTSRTPNAEITVGRLAEGPFYVRDNGAGFDMAYADKLFGVFQRLHTPKEFPGTGIGLATVNRIVTRHQGKVWAEAAIGEGATFYFTLGGEA